MRRPLALVALAALMWSNATPLRCATSASAPSESGAATEGHAPHAHAPAAPAPADESNAVHDGPAPHQGGTACGVLMACGSAIGAPAIAVEATLPEVFDRMGPTPLVTPAPADLSRDTPPPRRHA